MAASMDEVHSADHGSVLKSITPSLRDALYDDLQSALKPRRGRPSKDEFSLFKLNNQLLLQFHLLREDTSATWTETQSWFSFLCARLHVPAAPIHRLIMTVLRRLEKVQPSETSNFLTQELELESIGEYTKSQGITRDFLMSLDSCTESSHSFKVSENVPVGLVLELNNFKQQQNLTVKTLLCWLQCLCSKFDNFTTAQLQSLLRKLTTGLKNKQRRKNDIGGAAALQAFKDAPCFQQNQQCVSSTGHSATSDSDAALSSNSTSTNTNSSTSLASETASSSSSATPSDFASTSGTVSRDFVSTSGTVSCDCQTVMKKTVTAMTKKADEAFSLKNVEINTLKEVIEEQKIKLRLTEKENSTLHSELDVVTSKMNALIKNKQQLKKELREAKDQLEEMRRTNVWRENAKLQRKIKVQRQRNLQLQNVELLLQQEKVSKRKYQVRVAGVERSRRQLREALQKAENTIMDLLQQIESAEVQVPETRTDSGFFKEFVVKCIYHLIGECQVPAARCRGIIQAVAHHMFGVAFPDDTLPGKTTSLRFADQSHSLAKLQVAEEIGRQRFDLHWDGTTKRCKKYLGIQVTLENQDQLSMGFEPMAQENAQTLFEVALNKITELATLQSPEETQQELKNMLTNIVSFMSDRANTMKCAGRLFKEHLSTTLEKEVQIHFLHCNAHFLLGASAAVEKALVQAVRELELDGQLGREKLAAFSGFTARSSESAVCRYVRMACDTLGPRPDEKNGCHADWLAFCASMKLTSLISSFRSNRFNNLFEAAASLVLHKEDIRRFFELRQATNLKQRSVQADALCEDLNLILLAVALLYVYFTGPFWVFVRSEMHFLDQYTYIQPMYFALKELQDHPDLLLNDLAVPHDLESFRLRNNPAVDSVLEKRNGLTPVQTDALKCVMRHLARELIAVTERQLEDFLPGGKYASEPTEELRQQMQHCQLHNLTGEACFADLDFSMFKNRGASLHHHSTLNMVKRNKTVSRWLENKSPEARTQLIKRARSLGPQMRKTAREQQLLVWQEIAAQMEKKNAENAAVQARKEEKQRRQKDLIINTVMVEHGQTCGTAADIVTLLQKYHTQAAKVKALKAQIDYHKVVLQQTSPLLKTSQLGAFELATNLTKFLCGEEAANNAEQDITVACRSQRKCRRQEREREMPVASSSEEEDLSISEESDVETTDTVSTEDNSQGLSKEDFKFKFDHQGQTVAVFYNSNAGQPDFYIGQVINVINTLLADVTFLQQKQSDNTFKWPASEDLDQVSAIHVIFGDFEILGKGSLAG